MPDSLWELRHPGNRRSREIRRAYARRIDLWNEL